jgi:hypothetical protein
VFEVTDGSPERSRDGVSAGVVGKDPSDGDPVVGEPGIDSAPEPGAARSSFVVEDLGTALHDCFPGAQCVSEKKASAAPPGVTFEQEPKRTEPESARQ